MMSQVQKVTMTLIEAIKESNEYVGYQKAKQEMFKYPLLKEKVDEFRKRNYEMQDSRTDIFEEAGRLQQEYEQILKNAVVREYLNAENAFCRMIQQINWQIIDEIDFEADFIGKAERKAD